MTIINLCGAKRAFWSIFMTQWLRSTEPSALLNALSGLCSAQFSSEYNGSSSSSVHIFNSRASVKGTRALSQLLLCHDNLSFRQAFVSTIKLLYNRPSLPLLLVKISFIKGSILKKVRFPCLSGHLDKALYLRIFFKSVTNVHLYSRLNWFEFWPLLNNLFYNYISHKCLIWFNVELMAWFYLEGQRSTSPWHHNVPQKNALEQQRAWCAVILAWLKEV